MPSNKTKETALLRTYMTHSTGARANTRTEARQLKERVGSSLTLHGGGGGGGKVPPTCGERYEVLPVKVFVGDDMLGMTVVVVLK